MAIVDRPAEPVPVEKVDPARWAAARFVCSLAELGDWPRAVVPWQLEQMPPPADPAGRRQADSLLRLWTALLDMQRDGEAEWLAVPDPLP